MYTDFKLTLLNFDLSKKKIQFKGYNLKTVYLNNIIDLFLSTYVNTQNDKITLYSQALKKQYGCKYNYYLEYLQHKGFIYLYKNYSTGKHSKIYALTAFTLNSLKYLTTTSIKLTKHESKKLSTNINFIENTDVNKHILSSLYKVNINYDASIKWVNNNLIDRKKIINETNITKIFNGLLYYNYDRYGRLHTNFTNLKKDIRKNYLTINNNKLKELDIKNSQPFFLYLLLKNYGFNNFQGFDTDVLNGIIYDKLISYSKDNINRDEMKKNVYHVLFGRNTKSKWNNLFKEIYPAVYEWIVNYKKENKSYKALAHKLQEMESTFMYKTLIPNIIDKKPDLDFITIHDSIMFEEQYYPLIEPIFKQTLNSVIA